MFEIGPESTRFGHGRRPFNGCCIIGFCILHSREYAQFRGQNLEFPLPSIIYPPDFYATLQKNHFAARFDEPTFLSTNDGTAMLASNCDAVFFGPSTGLTYLTGCIPKRAPAGDQSVVSRIYRERAVDYMRAHKKRTAVVVLARIGRDWGLFRPGDMLDWNRAEGRPKWITGLGMAFYYPLLAFAIGGIVGLRRRRTRQWPLLIPAVIVTLGTVLAYGQTRFRVPAEPSLVVLAAVGIAALTTRWWPEPT